jgi:hypothetical protein
MDQNIFISTLTSAVLLLLLFLHLLVELQPHQKEPLQPTHPAKYPFQNNLGADIIRVDLFTALGGSFHHSFGWHD